MYRLYHNWLSVMFKVACQPNQISNIVQIHRLFAVHVHLDTEYMYIIKTHNNVNLRVCDNLARLPNKQSWLVWSSAVASGIEDDNITKQMGTNVIVSWSEGLLEVAGELVNFIKLCHGELFTDVMHFYCAFCCGRYLWEAKGNDDKFTNISLLKLSPETER
jgi:hypothetical protein